MEMSFAIRCPLAPHRRPHYPVLVHRLAPLLHASFRPRLATTSLRFAITSPPSGCEEDLHLQAVDHARHTNRHRGSGHPLSPATPPGHAGPHPAVRRIKLGPYDHGRKSELGKVGLGKAMVKGGESASRQGP